MNGSLLGHLAHRFGVRREPVATTAVCRIVGQHARARAALVQLLADGTVPAQVRERVTFATEVHDANDGGITDLEGRVDGLTWFVVEGKFGAPLQPVQPVGYAERLQNGGSLLFVCPDQRIPALAAQLTDRVDEAGIRADAAAWHTDEAGTRWLGLSRQRRLGITSWGRLLHALKGRDAADSAQFALLSDIHQLEGLVAQFEREVSQWTAAELTTGGTGLTFAKAVHAANDLCALVSDELGIPLPSRHPQWWKSPSGTLSPADYLDWYGALFDLPDGKLAAAFEPVKWGTEGFPSPLTLSINPRGLTHDAAQRVRSAYLRMADAATDRLREMLDHPPLVARTSEYGWWELPVPLRPDLTAQEARDDMAVTVKQLLAPLREL
ncbi:hypothetical protein [Kitasatospora sp. MBT66]|uniref:hypothetical protein n=1 Tax=Kitasatospora sp. MBT66 TaxID=1444769 RepID=UPI0005B7D06C|nr:hypothetical protein [Kitasatospora sp. MBT66]